MTRERFSHVIVVEDNEPELDLLCDILHAEGFQTIGCGSAAEGLELVKQYGIGVAIIDLRLPDFSGTQLLERVRELDEDIRVIIYTGAASFESVKEALNLGAFAYVEKLSDPSELLRHVHRAFRERADRYAADLESAVAERTKELARSNRELEDFASVVAHDLRSPLLTISGYCQIIQEEYARRFDTDAAEYFDHIICGVNRMNRLIEDLLDYSRVGRSAEPFEEVDLNAVLVQAKANLEASIVQSSAGLEVTALPKVPGNQTHLVQLFQNLIGNAIKFRREGVTPEVQISASRVAEEWQFAVKDNGIGIDQEHFEKIFQVFQRLHSHRYTGTGIGLALCKKIVERHKGRIWLESEPGRGTTFFFTLPAEKTAVSP